MITWVLYIDLGLDALEDLDGAPALVHAQVGVGDLDEV